MTLTIETSAQDIKAAKTEVLKETGHHSCTGRSEFIQQLADLMISEGKIKLADYSAVTDKQRKELGAAAFVMPLIEARYPHHASAAHCMPAFWNYITRQWKKTQATEATPSKGETKSAAKSKGAALKAKAKAAKSKARKQNKKATVTAPAEVSIAA